MPKLNVCANRSPSLKHLLDATGELYGYVIRESGAATVVDASKVPSHLWLLLRQPFLRVHVLHLVRDVRAVVHAWRQRRKQEHGATGNEYRRMPRRSLVRSGLGWLVENAAAESLGKDAVSYTRIRYEDFAAAPRDTVAKAVGELRLPDADLSFIDRDAMTLRPTHSIGGNPVRFIEGEFAIRQDDRWRAEMPRERQLAARFLGAPLMKRYGYLGSW